MVERTKRDIAAGLLRRFVDGQITNDDFMDQFPLDKNDPALAAVQYCVWLNFSDLKRHTLTGKYAPKPGAKAVLERCWHFLKSDRELQWPNPDPGVIAQLLSIFTLGLVGKLYDKKYWRLGDADVWPFFNKNEYEAELSRQSRGSHFEAQRSGVQD